MSATIGAYACPRGVFAVEFARRKGGLEVVRTFGVPVRLETPTEAAAQLVSALASVSARSASVAVAARGFGISHHTLPLPPTRDDLLNAIVDREFRRLEPQMLDPVVAWTPLPADPEESEANAPRQVLAGGCPRHATDAFGEALRAAGHRLAHFTILPAAVQRLDEEVIASLGTTALIAPLPDGPFLGFLLRGALRLVVEPPLAAEDDEVDATVLVEEAELGAMFVRQQFRGAQLDHVVLAHGGAAFADHEERLAERLGVPVQRLDVHGLSSASLMAMGAVLDAQAARPLALAGAAAGRALPGRETLVRRASLGSLVLAGLAAAWALFAAFSARDAGHALRDVQRRLEQESFGAAPMRQTADQRRLIRDAVLTLRAAQEDRVALQNTLAAIGSAIARPVRLDSLYLDRGSNGWIVELGGSVAAESNGLAVQSLHDFYRELPRRLPVERLSLEQLSYIDGNADDGPARVRFRLTFDLPTPEPQR